MPLTTQDFDKGVDFTGINPATAGDYNNLVDQASPHQDDANTGKGIVIVTTDTALNIPDVPDATTHTKWQKYIWQRIPFFSATDLSPIHYGWSPSSPFDTVFQQWRQTKVDNTAIITAITAVTGLATLAKNTADQAIALAQAVNTIATDAATDAGDALTASVVASQAANAAATAANTAISNANAATAAAASAQAAANAANAAITLYDNTHLSCAFSEQKTVGVDLGALTAGTVQRHITDKVDPFSIILVSAGKITFTYAGFFRFYAAVPAYTHANSVQALLVKDSDNSVILVGQSAVTASGSDTQLMSIITGHIQVVSGEVVRIDMKSANAIGLQGKAASLGQEYYTVGEIEQITNTP